MVPHLAMSLSTDQYYIQSGTQFVGRFLHEDLSLLPKKVCVLSSGGDPDQWHIEALSNGRYRLKARGAPAAESNGFLFAFLVDGGEQTEWVITLQPSNGLYTIEKPSGEGWVATNVEDGQESQIAVKRDSSDKRFFKIQTQVD